VLRKLAEPVRYASSLDASLLRVTEEDDDEPLTEEQLEFLLELLKDPDLDESDAELVLTVLKSRDDDVLAHLTDILDRFPSLSRRIYSFCQHVTDVGELVGLLGRFVKTAKTATEDQLFWIAKMAEDYVQGTPLCSQLLLHVYEHTAATTIVQAKVLEIKELKSGFQDIREGQLGLARMGVDCRIDLYAEGKAESDAEVRRQGQPDEQHRRRGGHERLRRGTAACAPAIWEQLGNNSAQTPGKTEE
jgi:hypothetical protein